MSETRWIAAAPDLYAACSEAFDFLGGVDGASEMRGKILSALMKAEAPEHPDPSEVTAGLGFDVGQEIARRAAIIEALAEALEEALDIIETYTDTGCYPANAYKVLARVRGEKP